MSENDELESNPLFLALQTKFRNTYELAQKYCFTVCIPQTSAIEGVPITQGLVDGHILRPSRFAQDHFESTDPFNSKVVSINENALLVVSGFVYDPPGSLFKIIGEELGYNKDFQSFKIYILDRVLDLDYAKVKRRSSSLASSFPDIPLSEIFQSRVRLDDHKSFLRRFPEHAKPLKNLNAKIDLFLNTFMIIPGYLTEASGKIKKLVRDCCEELETVNQHPSKNDQRFRSALKQSVENVVLGQVHGKLFPAIREEIQRRNKSLERRIDEAQRWNIDLEILGVRSELCGCQFPESLRELKDLEFKVTPLEKLGCLKKTLENIVIDVSNQQHSVTDQIQAKTEKLTINSDDLIPVLVAIFTRARIKDLLANLYYVDKFLWTVGSSKDGAAFALTTFEAAVQYLLSSDFETMIFVKKRQSSLKQENVAKSIPNEMPLAHYNSFKPSAENTSDIENESSKMLPFVVVPMEGSPTKTLQESLRLPRSQTLELSSVSTTERVSSLSASAMISGPTPLEPISSSANPSWSSTVRASLRASFRKRTSKPKTTTAREFDRDLDEISRMISSTSLELDQAMSLAQEQKDIAKRYK